MNCFALDDELWISYYTKRSRTQYKRVWQKFPYNSVLFQNSAISKLFGIIDALIKNTNFSFPAVNSKYKYLEYSEYSILKQ